MADFACPFADITGTTPNSTQSRRHYGGPLTSAPRAGDGRLVPAGLLAHGSSASPRLPAGYPTVARGATLAAYSCGGSHGIEASLDLAPRSLFTVATQQRAATRP